MEELLHVGPWTYLDEVVDGQTVFAAEPSVAASKDKADEEVSVR